MAWTTPITAVANAAFTAAQFNASVRDNLNETATAKFTASNQLFVSTGANAGAARTPIADYTGTLETTTSTSYTNLPTVGPTVTVTSGSRMIVCLFCFMRSGVAGDSAYMGYEITGASAISADDTQAIQFISGISQQAVKTSVVIYQGVTSGSNTVTGKYRVNAGTGGFSDRRIFVIPT